MVSVMASAANGISAAMVSSSGVGGPGGVKVDAETTIRAPIKFKTVLVLSFRPEEDSHTTGKTASSPHAAITSVATAPANAMRKKSAMGTTKTAPGNNLFQGKAKLTPRRTR